MLKRTRVGDDLSPVLHIQAHRLCFPASSAQWAGRERLAIRLEASGAREQSHWKLLFSCPSEIMSMGELAIRGAAGNACMQVPMCIYDRESATYGFRGADFQTLHPKA